VGRTSLTKVKPFYEDFQYQATSWDKERRVIAKIEWHPGELFPCGFCRKLLALLGFVDKAGT
jgi:hypothetical protein